MTETLVLAPNWLGHVLVCSQLRLAACHRAGNMFLFDIENTFVLANLCPRMGGGQWGFQEEA